MRRVLTMLGVVAVSLLVMLTVAVPAGAKAYPDVIPLPDGFQPEGITVGNGHTVYVGSVTDGDVYVVDLRTGEGAVLVDGPGPFLTLGLAFDARSGLLYVAGGFSGGARVYDSATGDLVTSYAFGGGAINDAVITDDAVYFTDSFASVLYKVELGAAGLPTGSFSPLPMAGFPNDVAEFNANGIVASPSGDSLIVVHSFRGELYRVDPGTGDAALIDLGGATAATGDGLVLVGHSLYVVQNFINQISEFRLDPDYSMATLTEVITDSDFDIPTTADNHGSSLYAVNSRFTTPPGPTVNYDIVRVSR